MGKKYPRSEQRITNIIDSSVNNDYVVFSGDEAQNTTAAAAFNGVVDSYSGRVIASRNSRLGFDPGSIGGSDISGRYGLDTEGYEAWRPSEQSRFNNIKDTILHSDMCYAKHGLIKNIIDLMGDFASQGIRIVHPNKRIERFYQNWFKKVCGKDRSERFLNNFYRLGNVVVRWQTAKLVPSLEERMYTTMASEQVTGAVDIVIEQNKAAKREIPWKYVFLHPATVDIVGGPLATFVGDPKYVIKLPARLVKLIKSPKTEDEKALVARLPSELIAAAQTRKGVLLPPEKTRVFSYKKDDWQEWGSPMISAILIDISLYEKLKLADRAALDGAISNIRIFKLGSLEHKIIPGVEAANKLASILEGNVQAGTIDLIWGPDIELIESKTGVHQFLGKEKYEPTLMAIYAGLGIPPTLTGTFGAAGTTNNFISLKTLTQRLEYGRDTLVNFWNEQIRVVQEAMGFRFPARVEFDFMNLGDDTAEKSLLVQLADRNLVSDEMLQRYFHHDPEMERIRINREAKDREAGRMVPKAGAFHDPMFEESLLKVFAQSGTITPSEAGVELEPKKAGEKPALLMKPAPAPGGSVLPGGKPAIPKKPNSGRPMNSKDGKVRKTKTFKPKLKASLELWASACQEDISKILNPMLLAQFKKANMRSLSTTESTLAEEIKFGVLCNISPMSKITDKIVHSALSLGIPQEMANDYKEWSTQISADLNRSLTLDESKKIQTVIYATHKGDNHGSSSSNDRYGE